MSTRNLDLLAMPPGIARLPRNKVGYPIPWFVAELDDGVRDFRIVAQEKLHDAVRFEWCWVCGRPAGRHKAFVIGPMCAVNRVSAEPPSHLECAVYSAKVCPFLSNPAMVRRERDLLPYEQGRVDPPGEMIPRNPGVALVWVTKSYELKHVGGRRPLFTIGDPVELRWYAQGRRATREEVLASIESGIPLLEEAAAKDQDPVKSLEMLRDEIAVAMKLVPA